jgi:amyloid beta precursor protein binding protein 1
MFKVEAADLGNNFLLDSSSLGEHRAVHVCNLLKELDPTVEASLVLTSPTALLEDRPGFFKQFSLVVATQVGAVA